MSFIKYSFITLTALLCAVPMYSWYGRGYWAGPAIAGAAVGTGIALAASRPYYRGPGYYEYRERRHLERRRDHASNKLRRAERRGDRRDIDYWQKEVDRLNRELDIASA